MKNAIITEFVKFKVLETITEEQLLTKADNLNDFLKKQVGFIDAELVKELSENSWQIIYHFESLEKVKAIGDKMRSSKEFDEIKTLMVTGSINVSLNNQLKNW